MRNQCVVDVKSHIGNSALFLLVTATDIETRTLHKHLKPFVGESQISLVFDGNQTYFAGIIGVYYVVHVQCAMGSISRDASISTVMEAIECWNPDYIIMVGIAFGKDRKKQKIGDVLISDSIVNYESQRVSKDNSQQRSPIPQSGKILLNRFRSLQGWEHYLPSGKLAEKHIGLILTGEKLVDNEDFKAELFGNYPNAIGGEMESFGVYTAAESKHKSEWIIVKGICDWADGNKKRNKKRNQEIAAEASVSICLTVLDNPAFDKPIANTTHMRIFSANDLYANSFKDILFLHREYEKSKVKLENLFVLQKYKVMKHGVLQEEPVSLLDYLSRYINDQKESNFLFIEGDAGCGKSSLISFLSYHYEKSDEIGVQLFKEKELITVRLRDIITNKIRDTGEFIHGVLNYLQVNSIDELEAEHPNAVIVLDGFDELCLIENMSANAESFIYDLRALGKYKLVITTRPKYIRIESLDFTKNHIILQHFDSSQRNEWLNKYTYSCGESINEQIRSYLQRISDEDAFGICDTPMTLYMIVAGKISNYALYNEWMLYNQIFYKELSETDYNSMFPNNERRYSHEIFKYRDIIYRISEEIAYRMFCSGNSKLYLSEIELKRIIEGFGINDMKVKEVVERCYALCSYWKSSVDRGIVEFYHNNIRDFFLCEKIFREINAIYQQIKGNSKLDIEKIAENFITLFHYGEIDTVVSKFILLRTINGRRINLQSDFPSTEHKQRVLPNLFEHMIVKCPIIKSDCDKNPIKEMINVLSCIVQVYRHAYEPYLSEDELVKWWNSHYQINESGMLKILFKYIFIKTPITLQFGNYLALSSKSDFSDINLHSCDLRNAGFNGSSLVYANMENTILCGTDFGDANLRNADFSNADMHYSKLSGSTLTNSNFIGVDLRGTELPDDFCSNIQDEQIEHLKSLKIEGLLL